MKSSEKKLLAILIILAVGIAFYYFVYSPIITKVTELRNSVSSMQNEMQGLKDKNNKNQIEKEIKDLKESNEKILLKYPAMLSEENAMRLVLDIEKDVEGIQFDEVDFNPVQLLSISSEGEIKAEDKQSTNLNGEQNGVVIDTGNLQVMKNDEKLKGKDISFFQTLELKSTMSYDSLKKMLTYINNYKNKTVVDDVTISSSAQNDMVDVTLSLRMLGISSSTNTGKVEFDGVEKGKTEFFKSSKSNVDGTLIGKIAGVKDDMGDMFIDIHSTSSDAPAQTVGMTKNSGSSIISQDANKVVNIDVTILLENERYVARYFMNGTTKKSYFNKGDALEIDVYSSKRNGSNDKVGVVLNLRNKSDDTVYVNLYDEDEDNPRFKIGVSEGKYKVR